ncbi:cytochrome c biogenesis protein CcsA [Pyrodictium abyssi]|uniref:Cytochrome c assembly protein domain-containing protein n=1 Tax=Pyrodictium abyssi TaxID=54256 RepID=A0ABM8ITR2_9CREN|nr:hypothetical protein PABY_05240 [Pyrodictium abyssi]
MALHYTGIIPALAALVYTTALYMLLRRDIGTASRLVKWASMFTVAGWLVYLVPFVTLDYSLEEVFWNTSPGLPLWMRIASAWAGGGGSLYLFAAISAIATLYIARGLAEAKKKDVLVTGAAVVTLAAIVGAFANGAFSVMEERPASGAGLNPLLKSPWLYPHPLSTFGGYALLSIGMVALLAGLRRRGLLVYELGWALLTLGIMLGGYWSYETFGWGGYWAWDPVETSELMVWLAATLLPHVMVAVPSLAAFTEYLTLSSVFLAMYVTRSGLSPLHSFAAANLGVAMLLVVALVALFLAFRRLGELRFPGLDRVKRSPLQAGMLAATIALFAAAIFVYATLLLPSMLTVVGVEATVPQMQSGVRYFHPVLYPLLVAMLAAIPLAFIGDRIGWRGYAALLAATSIASVVAGAAALSGALMLTPLSSSATNAMMAFGLPWAGLAAAAVLLYIALRLRGGKLVSERMTAISLLHLGLAVTVIGVLLSGTHSFNEAYFIDASMKPGEPVILPNGLKIELVGYEFELSNSTVDIYTGYAGRSLSYILAWDALAALASDYSKKIEQVHEAEKLLGSNETLRSLAELAAETHISTVNGSIAIKGAARVTGIDMFTGAETPIADSADITIELVNPSVTVAIEPVQDSMGRVKSARFRLYVTADEAAVAGLPGGNITARTVLDVTFAEPVRLTVGRVSLEISHVYVLAMATGSTGHPAVEQRDGVLVYKPALLVPSGSMEVGALTVAVPLDVPASMAGYVESCRDPLLQRLLGSSLAEALANGAALKALNPPDCRPTAETPHGICPGYIDVPHTVPETAWLVLKLRIEHGGDVREETVRLRFESYGEVQGIHGLVTKVIHPRVGLTDVYIAIHAPVVTPDWGVTGYHELLVYYLHAVYQSMNLTPAQRIALAALFASGYMMDTASSINDRMQRSLFLEHAAIELYLLAEDFSPENSTIARQGLPVQVKLVPGVALVWYGAVMMAVSAVYAAVVAAYTARRS